ncbi:MAG TPA: L,D-transpeptidase [Candidatus Nanopelagicaceae bacterium]|nr:L,D-transpeptidase [Candidatus Nanopelagicaceae bacterium]
MRASRWLLVGLGTCLVVAVAVDAPLAYHSSRGLKTESQGAGQLLSKEKALGLPAAQAASLQAQLNQVNTAQWWSPTFLFANQSGAIASLRAQTERDWGLALAASRKQAQVLLTSYTDYVGHNSAWLSAPSPGQVKAWSSQLQRAKTPGALDALMSQLQLHLTQATSEVKAAQAKAAASVTLANAPGGLLQEAAQLDDIAKSDNLAVLQVPQDAAALQQALNANQSGAAQNAALTQQLALLRAEIGLNNSLVQQSLAVMDLVDQAGAEQTPNSAAYLAQYQGSQQALKAAQTPNQLAQVQATLNTVQQGAQASLNSDQCGHTTISGKSIYISLSLQEMVFYDSGCVVKATPVTTGRPLLRTPTGTFHIFDKQSPYVFISPWPPGSPFWYPTSPVNWVMEFDQGGYYIHDAPWEPTSEYGPGSENLVPQASHGCVQTPGAVMAWAYTWTPMGTAVVIAN